MGRGRQKAKQTKVARDLKYNGGSMDVASLQRELSSAPTPVYRAPVETVEDDDEFVDTYADQFADEDEDN